MGLLPIALGIGSLAAGIFGSSKASSGQEKTNAANERIADKQMAFQTSANAKQFAFQERMSNTQYSRAMQDMRASGLNPMLAYKQGGAGTPSGATSGGAGIAAQNPDASWADLGSKAATAAQMYLQAKSTEASINNLDANTALAKTNASLSSEKIQTELAQQGQLNANSALLYGKVQTEFQNTAARRGEVANILQNNKILRANTTVAEKDATVAEIDAALYQTTVGEGMRVLEKMGLKPSDAKKVYDLLKKGKKAAPGVGKFYPIE